MVQNVVNYNISSSKPAFQNAKQLNSSQVMAGQSLSRSFVAADDEDEEEEDDYQGKNDISKILDFELDSVNVSVVAPPRTPLVPSSFQTPKVGSPKTGTKVEEYKLERISNAQHEDEYEYGSEEEP